MGDKSSPWVVNVGEVRYYNVMQSNTLPTHNILFKKKPGLNQNLYDSVLTHNERYMSFAKSGAYFRAVALGNIAAIHPPPLFFITPTLMQG